MTTLTVSATNDYSADLLSGTDLIGFTNTIHTVVTATFASFQFGSQIDADVQIQGSIGANHIVVNGGSISADDWTFSNWAASDSISLNGSSGSDIMAGSSQDDIITGGDGDDTMYGGNGDDVFVIAANELATGEVMVGGNGVDTLRINTGSSTADFIEDGSLSEIEILAYGSSGGRGTFHGSLFGSGSNLISTIKGGAGSDLLFIRGSALVDLTDVTFASWATSDIVTIVGTTANDTILGGNANENLVGGSAGLDLLNGGEGDDDFNFRDADVAGDTLDGGAGLDAINLASGLGQIDLSGTQILGIEELAFLPGDIATATLSGTQIGIGKIATVTSTNQEDTLKVVGNLVDLTGLIFTGWSSGHVVITGSNTANSTLIGSSEADVITGGTRNDLIRSGSGKDQVDGGDGSDRIDYSDQTLSVQAQLAGSFGKLVLVNGVTVNSIKNIENITGGSAGDTLEGDGAKNSFRGGGGNDTMRGSSGTDTADYSDKTQKVSVTLNGATAVNVKVNGVIEDSIKEFENLIGGSAGDNFTGDANKNSFLGGGGVDTLNGGAGLDTADYSDKTKKVEVTLKGSTTATVKVNGVNEDKIKNIENVTGGSAKDKLTGDGAKNVLRGNGNNDTLNGGLGNDTLNGGDGADHFRFTTALNSTTNVDHIASFATGSDKIVLENAIFAVGGSVSAGEFIAKASGHAATTGAQRLIYDKSKGELWYDPTGNGNGTSDAIKFAVLDNKPAALAFTDFSVI